MLVEHFGTTPQQRTSTGRRLSLYQVVLEHVYLGAFLRVVGSAAVVVDHRGGTGVLVFGGVGVEDVHRALLLGLRRLGGVVLLLGLVLRRESCDLFIAQHLDTRGAILKLLYDAKINFASVF